MDNISEFKIFVSLSAKRRVVCGTFSVRFIAVGKAEIIYGSFLSFTSW